MGVEKGTVGAARELNVVVKEEETEMEAARWVQGVFG